MTTNLCKATTRHGKQCHNHTMSGQDYCRHHLKQQEEPQTISIVAAVVDRWERKVLSFRSLVGSPFEVVWEYNFKNDEQILYWISDLLTQIRKKKLNHLPVVIRCSVARPINILKGFEAPENIQETEFAHRIFEAMDLFPKGVEIRWIPEAENPLVQRYAERGRGMTMTPEEMSSGQWLKKVYENATN